MGGVPCAIKRLALGVAVGAVQKDNLPGIAIGGQQAGKIFLGSDGLGENHGLAFAATLFDLVQDFGKACDEFFALGTGTDRFRQGEVGFQLGNFGLELDLIDLRAGLLGGFVRLVIQCRRLVNFVRQLDGVVGIRDRTDVGHLLALQTLANRGQKSRDGGDRRAENFAGLDDDELIWFQTKGDGIRSLQIGGDLFIEAGLCVRRLEVKRGGHTPGE